MASSILRNALGGPPAPWQLTAHSGMRCGRLGAMVKKRGARGALPGAA